MKDNIYQFHRTLIKRISELEEKLESLKNFPNKGTMIRFVQETLDLNNCLFVRVDRWVEEHEAEGGRPWQIH